MSVLHREPPALDVREEHALQYLRPALDSAVARNAPATAAWVPTSLSSRELVALAVRLCRHVGVNVAVLAHPDRGGVIFTPLL